MRGTNFTPEAALTLGLVDHVCEESHLVAEVKNEMSKQLTIPGELGDLQRHLLW